MSDASLSAQSGTFGGRDDAPDIEGMKYDTTVQALEAEATTLRRALAELVRLKDGPRDDAYRAAKDAAWSAARAALDQEQR